MSYQLLRPQSLQELLEFKNQYGADARILAGGSDLLVNIHKGLSPRAVISLAQLRPRFGMMQKEGALHVGLHVTLGDIIRDEFVRSAFPELAMAADMLGSLQTRNQATLIGNVCNASPAGDTLPPLLANDAAIRLASQNGERILPLAEFFTGPGKTCIAQDEAALEIILPTAHPAVFAAYRKLTRTRGVDLSGLGVCVRMHTEKDVRIALGAVAPTPIRCKKTEALIAQKGLQVLDAQQLAEGVMAEASPISDLRASREYRLAMVRQFSFEMLQQCRAAGQQAVRENEGR